MDAWTEWHLSPEGWTAGATWSRADGIRFVPRPSSAVLTVRSRTGEAARVEVVYAIVDENRVRALVTAHGAAPGTSAADPGYARFR